jgi:hypothetical protein
MAALRFKVGPLKHYISAMPFEKPNTTLLSVHAV